MSCARGCRGPAREPDSSRAHASSPLAPGSWQKPSPRRRRGTRGLGSSGHRPSHASGNGFPRSRCGEVGARVGELGIGAGRGLGSARGPRQPLRSRLAPEHPPFLTAAAPRSVCPSVLPASSPAVCPGGRGVSPRRQQGWSWLVPSAARWPWRPPPSPAAGWALPSGLVGVTPVSAPPSPRQSHVSLGGGIQLLCPACSPPALSSRSPPGFLSSSESEKATPRGDERRGSREPARCSGLRSPEMNKRWHRARP